MQLSAFEAGGLVLGHDVDNAHGGGVVGSLQHSQRPQAVCTCL